MIYTDFVFSGLRDSYFHNIKTLIKPLFEFDSVNVSGLTDLILTLKEDVGTVIKNEDEEETKSPNVDLFAIFSIIPISHYYNGSKTNESIISLEIFECLKQKLEKYASDGEKAKGLKILKSSKVALLLSERVINLPQEAVPICLNFLVNEIGECRDEDQYDGKFEFEYIIFISKFVKRLLIDDSKKTKKNKTENINEEILHYKYETEHMQKYADVNICYKIPYDQMNLDYLENKNEPQYYSIMFVKSKNFFDLVNYLSNNK
jgi:hypothetical protein